MSSLRTTSALVLIGLSATLAVAGCSPGSKSQSTTTSSSSMITIKNYAFQTPKSVKAGQKITVHNDDKVAHTVTSTKKAFDVRVGGGATVTFTAPKKDGSYPFICTYHPYMKSTLVVK